MKRIAELRYDNYIRSENGYLATRHICYFIDIADIVYIKSAVVTIDRGRPVLDRKDDPCEIGLVGGQTITVPLPIDRVMSALEAAVEADSFTMLTKPNPTQP